jgi:hypothetical protein
MDGPHVDPPHSGTASGLDAQIGILVNEAIGSGRSQPPGRF